MLSANNRLWVSARRALPALAALFVSVASLAVLLAGFDHASPRRWLTPSPEVIALVAKCDTLPKRAQREQCTRQVVAVLVERQHTEAMLAQR